MAPALQVIASNGTFLQPILTLAYDIPKWGHEEKPRPMATQPLWLMSTPCRSLILRPQHFRSSDQRAIHNDLTPAYSINSDGGDDP